jgi:alkyl sulfatase BDS1-like metallo-beta-lactamase superfamily hydrolase
MTTTASQDQNHDFHDANFGLLRTLPNPLIYSDFKDKNGERKIVWDADAYQFLSKECPDTANESLWRQGRLCSATAGLYAVTDGIYQVRGLDIANMTIVQIPHTNGIVVIDCLASNETARAGIELYQAENRDKHGIDAEIKALIYTHCHKDHFGNARAVTKLANVASSVSDSLRIIGPDGFLEHAVSENIYAGPAMAHRAIYMYGEALEKSPKGQIGSGLGQAVYSGNSKTKAFFDTVLPSPDMLYFMYLITSLLFCNFFLEVCPSSQWLTCPLTRLDRGTNSGHHRKRCPHTWYRRSGNHLPTDSGTEAPAEVNLFFPTYNALYAAENAIHTLHNIQTLRGAPVRDARMWSRYLDETIVLFGDKTDIVFASHHWPTWNRKDGDVVKFLSEQHDYYAYLHNESLRLLNDGQTPLEIAETIQMPPNLSTRTNLQGYYGSISHDVKGIYDKYMSWFDGNPAYLWPLAPADEATEYVKCIGGAAAVLGLAQEYYANRNFRFAATLLDKLIFATQSDPEQKDSDASNQVKQTLISVYTDLGYGAENGT